MKGILNRRTSAELMGPISRTSTPRLWADRNGKSELITRGKRMTFQAHPWVSDERATPVYVYVDQPVKSNVLLCLARGGDEKECIKHAELIQRLVDEHVARSGGQL